MPASKQNPAAPTPASPQNTAKYTNKDGSKFITVPKATPSDSSQPSTPTATTRPGDAPLIFDPPAPSVNRKKQKRRQKAAAKAAAELAANGHNSPAPAPPRQPPLESDEQEAIASDDDAEDTEIHGHDSYPTVMNGHSALTAAKSKKNKKKKTTMAVSADQTPPALTTTMTTDSPISVPAASRGPGMSRDKIWSTSNHEERERIKEFWLGLGEEERKFLVKVEKDAVLKKMKEQQKHTCSCTVCGRKRTAIEEELEGLYDAYYLELEQFANQGEGPPMLSPPPRDFPLRPPRRLPSRYAARSPSRGRIVEHVGDDDEELEEAYSEDEVDDEFSDEEPPEEIQNVQDRDVADFLTFGNSLQVKGGILTVADDLLKNDGKRFIEMMEQLAERRMAREEDARDHFSRAFSHPDGSYSNPHNHSPPDEDEYEEEDEDEDDYEDSQEEEYDEEDQMTEEQRMEEGRRMFQIFAARMFEQRVLSAYKEKVAKERQQKLLEELEEESRQVDEQKAKKAKNAQKKKDKAAQKKQALAEDKARREASKAADEAARLEVEQKRAAEQRQKAEEKRKQKEAQRKAEEDARLKKEAERQRRIHEQQEKQAEQERKARELKERDKRFKEEQRIREKEAREQRERGAQERKEKQEHDKRDKEARAAVKACKEAHEAAPSRERGRDEKTAHKAGGNQHGHGLLPPAPKRGHAGHHPVSIPTVLPQHPSNPAAYASPKVPVATPVIPKVPTPIRPRTMSQQQQPTPPPPSSSPSQQSQPSQSSQPPRPPQPSQLPQPPPLELGHGQASSVAAPPAASKTSQNPSPRSATAAYASPGPVRQERKASLGGLPMASQPYPTQPLSPHTGQPKPPAGQPVAGFQIPPMGMQAPPGLGQQRPPGFGGPMAHDGMLPLGFRPGPKVMAPPPGINGPAGRGFPLGPLPPPGFPQGASGGDQFPLSQGFGLAKEAPAAAHVRQHSTAGYDGTSGMASQPIGRPAPIGRPCSISQGNMRDSDDDAKRLGSRVLVEDDEPLSADLSLAGLRNQPPGPRGGGFATSPFMDAGFPMGHGPWGPPGTASQPFQPPGFGNTAWASPTIPPGFSVGSPAPTSGMGSLRTSAQPRHVALRLMLCQACKDLASTSGDKADGFVELGAVRAQIESQTGDATIVEPDLLNLCDTEGNGSNGGGVFEVRYDASGLAKCWIRWVPDALEGRNLPFRAVGAPGEIGSPLTGHASIRGI